MLGAVEPHAQGRPPVKQSHDQGRPSIKFELTQSLDDEVRAAIDAELARVKALSDAERAAVGKRYTDPEALFDALDAGGGDATFMLRGSWVKTQRGGRLPKRGDPLPPEATITVAELRAIAKASKCRHGALCLLYTSPSPRDRQKSRMPSSA